VTGQDFFSALFTQGMPRGTATERRLAKYARYRRSEKGQFRTSRYNLSVAHKEACRRYRDCHVVGPESYQTLTGRWKRLMKVDPADKAAIQSMIGRLHGYELGWLYREVDAETTSAQRMLLSWGMNHQLLTSPPNAGLQPDPEAVWDRTHGRFARAKKGTWQWKRTKKNPDGNLI
jgi:hypothetical protein